MARFSGGSGGEAGPPGADANTGDITFDGIRIIGAGTAAGDGSNNGTIRLVPDGDLTSDQYLIIDPTAPNHIHIRAGGAQDASSSSLIFGGERNHVLVSDGGRTVSVSTRPETVINTYINTNPTSNTNFTVSNTANIYVGDTVFYSGGDVLTVDSVTPNSPSAGTQTVTANLNGTPGQFVGNGAHIFSHEQEWNNSWIFGDDGVLSGPAMGSLAVNGIYNSIGNDLYIGSGDAVVVTGTEGEFLNDSNTPGNQIATLNDVGIESSYTVSGGTDGTAPTFTGAPLFSGSYIKTAGSLVHFQIQVDMDNITSFGTGQYFMDLPFPAKYGYMFREGCLHDISTNREYHISGHVYAGQSQMLLFTSDTQGNNLYDFAFSQGEPITLSTADNFHIAGTYIMQPYS